MKLDERGSISALVVGLMMSFVACAGLAVDGGRLISAKVRVSDEAENAARTGAQAVTDLRLGVPVVDQVRAVRISRDFLGVLGSLGVVSASKFEVCVLVRETVPMTLLSIIGVRSRDVVTRRCASPIME